MASTGETLFSRLINSLETQTLLNDVDGNPILDDGTLVKRILDADASIVSCRDEVDL